VLSRVGWGEIIWIHAFRIGIESVGIGENAYAWEGNVDSMQVGINKYEYLDARSIALVGRKYY